MTMLFRDRFFSSPVQSSSSFNKDAELKKHAWHSHATLLDAEKILSGKPSYTYITRPGDAGERGFAISFVNRDGNIAHLPFYLICPKNGIWRNCFICHVGRLEKVISDMMGCDLHERLPL